jgi:ketosteroid isomerase-like protein
MDARDTITGILDTIYAARRANDAKAAAAAFATDAQFGPNGMPPAKGVAERANALAMLFDEFQAVGFTEHCRIIDPPRASVHWRGTFRAKNGRVGETDVLDVIEFRDGQIVSLTTFFDTAYAAALRAPV